MQRRGGGGVWYEGRKATLVDRPPKRTHLANHVARREVAAHFEVRLGRGVVAAHAPDRVHALVHVRGLEPVDRGLVRVARAGHGGRGARKGHRGLFPLRRDRKALARFVPARHGVVKLELGRGDERGLPQRAVARGHVVRPELFVLAVPLHFRHVWP